MDHSQDLLSQTKTLSIYADHIWSLLISEWDITVELSKNLVFRCKLNRDRNAVFIIINKNSIKNYLHSYREMF